MNTALQPSASDSARSQALAAERSRPFRVLVRAGFGARGVTYLVVGGLALALALGAGTDHTKPNQQGALSLIARAPLGRVAMIIICAGLLGYALWKIGQGIFGRGPEGGGGSALKDRVSNLAGGIFYLGFLAIAVRVLVGGGGSAGSAEAKKAAAGVLGWPAGPVLVGGTGLVLLVVGTVQTYDAFKGDFAEESKTGEMGARERRVFLFAGRAGLTARALVLALIGYFLLRTAIDYSPSKAVGVDGALARVHAQPFGPWLLGLVAAGLITFGAYSLLDMRYRRL